MSNRIFNIKMTQKEYGIKDAVGLSRKLSKTAQNEQRGVQKISLIVNPALVSSLIFAHEEMLTLVDRFGYFLMDLTGRFVTEVMSRLLKILNKSIQWLELAIPYPYPINTLCWLYNKLLEGER